MSSCIAYKETVVINTTLFTQCILITQELEDDNIDDRENKQ